MVFSESLPPISSVPGAGLLPPGTPATVIADRRGVRRGWKMPCGNQLSPLQALRLEPKPHRTRTGSADVVHWARR
eukprot:9171430-Pyramimonas_sp.AAC.1